MKSLIRQSGKMVWRSLDRLCLMLFFGLLTLSGMTPAEAAVSVPVDQQPLTVRLSPPPNIMLMLDDSGSMDWDYMPDWDYIGHCKDSSYYNCDPYTHELQDASINGSYYNPTVVYSPPLKADGSSYPNSPGMGNAYKNGFTDTSSYNEVDVTGYDGSYDYYTKVTSQVPVGSYAPDPGCKPGDDLENSGSHAGECLHEGGKSYVWKKPKHGSCGGWDWDWHDHQWMCRDTVYSGDSYYAPSLTDPSCDQGDYDATSGMCLVTTTKTAYLFTYTSHDTSGNAQRHFVGKTAQDCNVALADTADYPNATCEFDAATQQNVANWFSYYRTRMLLAKSGLMNAFSGLDENYRVGFASIHNNGGFPSGVTTTTSDGMSLATVKAFGDGSSSSDQKNAFWQWIVDAYPNNGTPLRKSLQAVGDYYKTAQPWQSKDISGNTQNLSCRQSYAILTTDGFWNGGSPQVGNVDGTAGVKGSDTITGPNGETYLYKAEPPFTDSNGSTLADVAMDYWKHDLMPTLNNEVPTTPADPAFWQHMVSFTIGMGFLPKDASGNDIDDDTVQQLLDWTVTPGAAGKPAGLSSWGGWPKPESDSINNIADLVHAGVNGHGGFYSATSPVSFTNGLANALARASERAGTGASLAANSTHLDSGTMTYQAVYHTSVWTGELKAFSVDKDTGVLSSVAVWDASTLMPAAASRNIYTYNPASSSYLAFTTANLASLSAGEKTALGTDTAAQTNMLEYLRGNNDPGSRAGGWRQRESRLGDIVHSQPVFVGAVTADEFKDKTFTGSSAFDAFASAQASRANRVYVAANDGMLHAFDATTGVETYAYLPAAVIQSGVEDLADPGYGSTAIPHRYFNDGEMTVADAYFKGPSAAAAAWHTVLVGTTGLGDAKAVYALDVTNPAAITFLWERSASDGKANSDYIGQIAGKPLIAQVADGDWAVLIGNGYNSTRGSAALLQFNLADGSLSVHQTDNGITGNGLAAPVAWIGEPESLVSTVAYAGDLKGNVWEFELSKLSGQNYAAQPSSTGTNQFIAKDADGNTQPITAGMMMGRDPSTGNLMLFFGTGRSLAVADRADDNIQTWYGLIVSSANSDRVVSATSTRDDLAKREILYQEEGGSDSLSKRVISMPHSVDATTTDIANKKGWYIDLAYKGTKQGERILTPNQFLGNLLVGTSRVPESTDPCNPDGRGWVMAISPFSGTSPLENTFDANRDGVIDDNDKVTSGGKSYVVAGIGLNTTVNNPTSIGPAMEIGTSDGGTETILTSLGSAAVTMESWREVLGE